MKTPIQRLWLSHPRDDARVRATLALEERRLAGARADLDRAIAPDSEREPTRPTERALV